MAKEFVQALQGAEHSVAGVFYNGFRGLAVLDSDNWSDHFALNCNFLQAFEVVSLIFFVNKVEH